MQTRGGGGQYCKHHMYMPPNQLGGGGERAKQLLDSYPRARRRLPGISFQARTKPISAQLGAKVVLPHDAEL